MRKILFVVLISISFFTILAAPGDLDTTFGVSGGYVISDFLGTQTAETVNDVVVQSDGKIIIAGSVTPSVNLTDFLVARYNPDGTLDTTFSGDGIFTLDQGGADEVHAIVLQPDGKIVAVGEYGTSTANMVFRLNSNGSLDGTFGGGSGKIQILTVGKALSVAIQPSDNKIIVGGYTNLNEATICRLNTNGFLDTTFDSDGIAFYPQLIRANGVAIQSNGRIVFTGSISGDTATARILSNGTLDSSFGSSGVVITAVYAGTNEGDAILVQSDGKILVSGGGGGTDGGALLVRYNSNGTLDTSFDGDGTRLHQINPNGDNFYNDIAQQTDGKILAVGTITYSILNVLIRDKFTLSRFNADGSFDNSFDGNGAATSQWCESASGMFLQSDGKIAAVGLENADSNRGTCTQRFNSDGSADSTFNPNTPNGKITQIKGTVEAVAGLPNGKIMVAGWEPGGAGFDTATLIRLNADGSLDTAFADDGVYEYSSGNPTYFYDLKVLSDGSFYVAGEGGTLNGAIMIKFDSSGNLDTTFSGDGIATAGTQASRFFSIAIQSDGKIFGCGSSGSGLAPRNGKFVRFATDGTIETSVFNSLNTPVGGDSEILACAFDPFGKLVVAGYSDGGANERPAISRHFVSLGVDTFFGNSGYVINDMSPTLNDRATDLVIQPDNKIVVSSMGLNNTGDRDYAVLRYDSNGALDSNLYDNFGNGGISLVNFGALNPNDEANALLLQPDGQIIAGGISESAGEKRFTLAKLNANGSPTLGFGTLGRVSTIFPNNDAAVFALSFYSNDRILAAGKSWNGADYDFAVARYENFAAALGVEGDIAARPTGDNLHLSNDLILIRQFINGSAIPDYFNNNEFQRADIAPISTLGDGLLLSNDLIQMRRYITGADSVANAGGPHTQNVARLDLEVDSDKFVGKFDSSPRGLKIQSIPGSRGNQVTVNILADALGDEAAYSFQLNYDSGILNSPLASPGTAGGSSVCNTAILGQIRCSVDAFPNNNSANSDAGIGEIGAGENQILLTVTFTIAANAPVNTNTPITIANLNASNDIAVLVPITGQDGNVSILAPTVTNASVGGRILTANGRGLRNVFVKLIDAETGETKSVISNSFGYFRFQDLPVGRSYVLSVRAKKITFAEPRRVITLTEHSAVVNFTATD